MVFNPVMINEMKRKSYGEDKPYKKTLYVPLFFLLWKQKLKKKNFFNFKKNNNNKKENKNQRFNNNFFTRMQKT